MINGTSSSSDGNKLFEICRRVSCGVATGADSIFVKPLSELEPKFRPFAFPTLSGRELAVESHMVSPKSCLLIPYARDGSLLGWEELGALQKYLSDPQIRHRLMQRTCATRKVWYAYHETPVLDEILRPKILCKDITSEPHFWIDRKGTIVPRHSIYYIVPEDPSMLDELADYLNSPKARDWLLAHCQRASKGFLRIQSRILKNLPLPQRLTLSSSRKNANVRTFAPRIQSTALVAVN
jgi:hypothetical protein